MARRLRLPSWVDDKEEAKPLPVVPLRYQISKVEKAFDDLDAQELALDKEWLNGLDPVEYDRLKAIIYHRREALHVRRLKEAGEYRTPAQQRKLEAVKQVRTSQGFSLPNWVWWLVFTIIIGKIVL